jgi:hypothetical protein
MRIFLGFMPLKPFKVFGTITRFCLRLSLSFLSTFAGDGLSGFGWLAFAPDFDLDLFRDEAPGVGNK